MQIVSIKTGPYKGYLADVINRNGNNYYVKLGVNGISLVTKKTNLNIITPDAKTRQSPSPVQNLVLEEQQVYVASFEQNFNGVFYEPKKGSFSSDIKFLLEVCEFQIPSRERFTEYEKELKRLSASLEVSGALERKTLIIAFLFIMVNLTEIRLSSDSNPSRFGCNFSLNNVEFLLCSAEVSKFLTPDNLKFLRKNQNGKSVIELIINRVRSDLHADFVMHTMVPRKEKEFTSFRMNVDKVQKKRKLATVPPKIKEKLLQIKIDHDMEKLTSKMKNTNMDNNSKKIVKVDVSEDVKAERILGKKQKELLKKTKSHVKFQAGYKVNTLAPNKAEETYIAKLKTYLEAVEIKGTVKEREAALKKLAKTSKALEKMEDKLDTDKIRPSATYYSRVFSRENRDKDSHFEWKD